METKLAEKIEAAFWANLNRDSHPHVCIASAIVFAAVIIARAAIAKAEGK